MRKIEKREVDIQSIMCDICGNDCEYSGTSCQCCTRDICNGCIRYDPQKPSYTPYAWCPKCFAESEDIRKSIAQENDRYKMAIDNFCLSMTLLKDQMKKKRLEEIKLREQQAGE